MRSCTRCAPAWTLGPAGSCPRSFLLGREGERGDTERERWEHPGLQRSASLVPSSSPHFNPGWTGEGRLRGEILRRNSLPLAYQSVAPETPICRLRFDSLYPTPPRQPSSSSVPKALEEFNGRLAAAGKGLPSAKEGPDVFEHYPLLRGVGEGTAPACLAQGLALGQSTQEAWPEGGGFSTSLQPS